MRRRQYWQIAAGGAQRDFTDAFLRYGMAFVGGDQPVARMSEVQVGDVVLLKRGRRQVAAVGEVIERDGRHSGEGDKDWLLDFDGWMLRAYCFVRWHEVPEPDADVTGLTRGTIAKTKVARLQELADEMLSRVPPRTEYLPEPAPTKPVTDDEILTFLIEQGLRPGAAEDLTSTFRRVRLLARYYYDQGPGFWEQVREHETRTFLVVPLLLALGWAEQRMKIELPAGQRLRADLGCYSAPYANSADDRLILLVETKGFSQGLDLAPEQVFTYAQCFGGCEVVAVTNGYCYKIFEARHDEPRDEDSPPPPLAYLNLLRPRDRYPLDPTRVAGALEALKLLLP